MIALKSQPSPNPRSENDYLAELGTRIRTARARRGMTRKILARDSGVSERYLAQLEAGQGNISINLLREVARALGVALKDLVQEGPERSFEWTLLTESLARLDPQQLERARQLLLVEFGRLPRSGRYQRMALIGLRGAGKSTLGALLSERLGVPFMRLSKEIEREAGTSLSEIFSLYGQAGYRRYEKRTLEAILARYQRVVIEVPGGLVAESATYELLLSSCFVVWLMTAPEEHMARVIAQGDRRPMNDNNEAMEDLKRILQGRAPLYGKADAVVDTAGKTVEASLERLLQCIDANPLLTALTRRTSAAVE